MRWWGTACDSGGQWQSRLHVPAYGWKLRLDDKSDRRGLARKTSPHPMKMVIDLPRHRLADALDRLQVGEAGLADRLGRAEVVQQRLLALGADAGDLLQGRAQARLAAAGADRHKGFASGDGQSASLPL